MITFKQLSAITYWAFWLAFHGDNSLKLSFITGPLSKATFSVVTKSTGDNITEAFGWPYNSGDGVGH